MKKVFLTLAMLLIAFTGVMRAQETLTVHDGTATNGYVPVYGYYADSYLKAEMVYPAEDLSVMASEPIHSITFYASQTAVAWGSTFQVSLTEIDGTTLSDFAGPGTVVYEGTLAITDGVMKIKFDTPYEYQGGNLLVCVYNTTTGSYLTSTWYGEEVTGAAVSGYSYSSLDAITATVRNFLPKATFVYGELSAAIEVNPTAIDLGDRPIGAWMAPAIITLNNVGTAVAVTDISTDNSFFTSNTEVPFTMQAGATAEIEIGTGTGDAGEQEGNVVLVYNSDRNVAVVPVTANAYEPVDGDVWEKAIEVTSFPYSGTAPSDIRHNYELNGDDDAADAVYKVTFDEPVMFNAGTTGASGVTLMYNEDFEEVGGPDSDNYYEYNGPFINPGPKNLWFSYDYTGNNTYFGSSAGGGMYFGYRISAETLQELELGDCSIMTVESAAREAYPYDLYLLQGDDLATANLLYYQPMNFTPEAQYFFSLNLDEPVVAGDSEDLWVMFYSESPYAAYTGKVPVDPDNAKIYYSMDGETWTNSTARTPVIYVRFLELPTGREVTLSPSDMTLKPIKGQGNVEESVAEVNGVSQAQAYADMHNNMRASAATYQISDMYVPAGTYYVAVASTDDNFQVDMSTSEASAPEQAFIYAPMDGEQDVEAPYLAEWMLGYYTEEMQVLIGTVYPPTTVLIDWTDELVESAFLTDLENNKTYFLQVNSRNAMGTVSSYIIGFTTTIDPVEGFAAEATNLYPGDAAVFTWEANRSHKGYNLYMNDTLVNAERITETTYTVEGLEYNTEDGYKFQVSAIYDEGESALSDPIYVYMTGTGNINGYVYEIDSLTPVYNVAVELRGVDEYGEEQTIAIGTTNPSGYYEGEALAGTYKAYGVKEGYQDTPSEEFVLANESLVENANIYMLEDWAAPGTITATEQEDDVLVEWGWEPASMVVDFETGDFSQAEFTLPTSYPWAITTSNVYEGTYAMKSTCEGVASGVSSIEATVEVPYAAKMGFYVKLSSETNYDKFYFYIDGVAQGQPLSGAADYSYKEFTVDAGTHTYKWEYAKDGSVNSNDDCIYVDNITMYRQDVPLPPTPGAQTFSFDSDLEGWTLIDNDGDGHNWYHSTDAGSHGTSAVTSHSGAGHVMGESYCNATYAVLTPDDYMVAPTQIDAHSGASISFWACTQDESYPSEHFGVAVSTTGNSSASAFTTIQEWTLTAKKGYRDAEAQGLVRGAKEGAWYQYSADLSSYAGQTIWVALRHFNCSDMFLMCVDDVVINDGSAKGFEQNRTLANYRLYRRDNYRDSIVELIAEPAIDATSYNDAQWNGLDFGIYQWGIQAIYEGNHNYPENVRSSELTIHDGTATNANVPVYGLYTDSYLKCEMIYPAAELANMNGATISSMKFYAQQTDITWGSTFQVFMKEVDDTTVTSFTGADDATVVYQGELSIEGGEMIVDFTTDYTYNGGNLLVGFYNIETASYASSYWYGEEVTGASFSGYSYSDLGSVSGYQRDFLPKTTFTYAGGTGGTTGGVIAEGFGCSDVLWSNVIEKDMEADLTFNLTLNNNQSPAGAVITLTGAEEYDGTVEETSYVFEGVRKGAYLYTVELEGYEVASDSIEFTADQVIDINLVELLLPVTDLYVSPTGWAKWTGTAGTGGSTPTPGPSADEYYDFEDDFTAQELLEWTTIDANNDGYDWYVRPTALTTLGHNNSQGFVTSFSYNGTSGVTPDNYLVSPNKGQYSQISFYACAQDAAYAAEHFGVAVSTASNTNAADFTTIQEWTMTAKAVNGAKLGRGMNDTGSWYEYTVDLSAYAGQDIWVAIRHFDCYDMFRLNVDDITLSGGSKGTRAALAYKIELEGLYEGDSYNNFWQHNVDNLNEGDTLVTRVAAVYATGMSEWVEYEWVYAACDNYAGATDVTATENEPGTAVELSWTMPEGGQPTPPTPGTGDTFTEGFESGMPTGWTVIDANSDGTTWTMTSAIPTTWTYYASLTLDWYRTGTNAICSGSYVNGIGALNPDEYLVTPQVTLTNGSTFSFWAAATDASYAADHFGVFVSDNGTSDWTMVNEWTLTGKSDGLNGGLASRNGNGAKLGTWYNYSVDLSAYAGQKYIAIRHFNCTDQYIMVVDDIELSIGTKGNRDMWDYVTSFSGTSAGQQAVATDGNYIYTASWQATPTGGYTFYKYELDGTFVEGFNITGATGIRDLTTDGEYFYGSSGSAQIFCLDLANKTLVSTINCSGLTSRHLTYDPERDGFWSGNWTTLALYDRTGALVQTAAAPTSAYGSAYYKDADGVEHLFLFCQPDSDAKVYDYNIGTNTISSSPVLDFASTPSFNAGIAGGCFIGTYDNKTCWFGNAQQDPNLIGIYELDATSTPPVPPTPQGNILGALVYRDGELLTLAPISETTYVDEAMEIGEHEYCIRVVYDDWSMSCMECAEVNYTGVVENDVVDNLYPNPTRGNVTIEAQGMNHITVVSTLGQVVYDADVDADMINLNLGNYKAGVYMIRVNTQNGVSVKRVTVVR